MPRQKSASWAVAAPHVDAESLGQNVLAQHKSEGEPEYELSGNLGEPDSGPLFTYLRLRTRRMPSRQSCSSARLVPFGQAA